MRVCTIPTFRPDGWMRRSATGGVKVGNGQKRGSGPTMTEKNGYGNTTDESPGLDYADKLVWLRPVEDFDRRVMVWNEVKTAQQAVVRAGRVSRARPLPWLTCASLEVSLIGG